MARPVAFRFNHFSDFQDGKLVDLSAGGMFVRTDALHPVASVFEFRFRPAADLPTVSGKAQVVWLRGRHGSEDAQAGMGARFVELDDQSRRLIERVMGDQGAPEPAVAGVAKEPAADPCREAIVEHLRSLKLPAFAREYGELARRAREAGWEHERFLLELLEAEIASRRENAAALRLRNAGFPELKTIEQIDWQAVHGISEDDIAPLARCEYIERAENVVFYGPVGTGKSHLAIALGIEATRRRYSVLFRRATDVVNALVEARDRRELGRLQRRLRRVDLLIVDELGFVQLDEAGGQLLFDLISARCEQRSTMLTSNLAFTEWDRLFNSEALARALVDRLSHRAHVLVTTERSYRRAWPPRRGTGEPTQRELSKGGRPVG